MSAPPRSSAKPFPIYARVALQTRDVYPETAWTYPNYSAGAICFLANILLGCVSVWGQAALFCRVMQWRLQSIKPNVTNPILPREKPHEGGVLCFLLPQLQLPQFSTAAVLHCYHPTTESHAIFRCMACAWYSLQHPGLVDVLFCLVDEISPVVKGVLRTCWIT